MQFLGDLINREPLPSWRWHCMADGGEVGLDPLQHAKQFAGFGIVLTWNRHSSLNTLPACTSFPTRAAPVSHWAVGFSANEHRQGMGIPARGPRGFLEPEKWRMPPCSAGTAYMCRALPVIRSATASRGGSVLVLVAPPNYLRGIACRPGQRRAGPVLRMPVPSPSPPRRLRRGREVAQTGLPRKKAGEMELSDDWYLSGVLASGVGALR